MKLLALLKKKKTWVHVILGNSSKQPQRMLKYGCYVNQKVSSLRKQEILPG